MVVKTAPGSTSRALRRVFGSREYATISRPKVSATVKVSETPEPSSSSPRDEPAGAIQATVVVTNRSPMNRSTTNEPTQRADEQLLAQEGAVRHLVDDVQGALDRRQQAERGP